MHKSPPSVPCIHSEEHSAEYISTPFGLRKFLRRKKIVQDEKKPTSSNVDSQLQNIFAKRIEKISDPNALEELKKQYMHIKRWQLPELVPSQMKMENTLKKKWEIVV